MSVDHLISKRRVHETIPSSGSTRIFGLTLFGLAFVIMAGILVDRAGVRLTGPAGAARPMRAGAVGLALGAARIRGQSQLFPVG